MPTDWCVYVLGPMCPWTDGSIEQCAWGLIIARVRLSLVRLRLGLDRFGIKFRGSLWTCQSTGMWAHWSVHALNELSIHWPLWALTDNSKLICTLMWRKHAQIAGKCVNVKMLTQNVEGQKVKQSKCQHDKSTKSQNKKYQWLKVKQYYAQKGLTGISVSHFLNACIIAWKIVWTVMMGWGLDGGYISRCAARIPVGNCSFTTSPISLFPINLSLYHFGT